MSEERFYQRDQFEEILAHELTVGRYLARWIDDRMAAARINTITTNDGKDLFLWMRYYTGNYISGVGMSAGESQPTGGILYVNLDAPRPHVELWSVWNAHQQVLVLKREYEPIEDENEDE